MPLNNTLQGAVWPQNTWSNVNRTYEAGRPRPTPWGHYPNCKMNIQVPPAPLPKGTNEGE